MMTIRDPERFQKIASGVQAIAVTLAVVIGGGWTLYAFTSQLEVEHARADLENATEELKRLRRDLKKEPKIEIEIDLKQTYDAKADRSLILGVVVVKNVGNTTTVMNLEDRPIKIYKVEFDEFGNESWEKARELELLMTEDASIASLSAHASAANSASFATYLDEPGLYVVRFGANRSKEEAMTVLEMGAKMQGPKAAIEWSNVSYIFVESP